MKYKKLILINPAVSKMSSIDSGDPITGDLKHGNIQLPDNLLINFKMVNNHVMSQTNQLADIFVLKQDPIHEGSFLEFFRT